MNVTNNILIIKELKLMFDRKKIFIYILLGLLFPTIMEFIFTVSKPIIPLQQAMQIMLLFVAMLCSEFLYISLIDELKYNNLDIMLISPIQKSRTFFLKSLFPFLMTLCIIVLSPLIHDFFANIFITSSISIFNYQNILFLIIAAIFSLFGEWLCLLINDNYNVQNHTIIMSITYGIVIGLFFIQDYIYSFLFYFMLLTTIGTYYAIVLYQLKLKDKNEINHLYIKSCFKNKKMTFLKAEFLRMLCELRNTKYLYMKLSAIFMIPSVYIVFCTFFQSAKLNYIVLWMLLFVNISMYTNKIIFPSYMSDVFNQTSTIRYVAGIKIHIYFTIATILLGIMFIVPIIILIQLTCLLLDIVILNKLYFLAVISTMIHSMIAIMFSKQIKDIKDYKIVSLLFSIFDFFIHYLMFILY